MERKKVQCTGDWGESGQAKVDYSTRLHLPLNFVLFDSSALCIA
jgi:hypothetical protein